MKKVCDICKKQPASVKLIHGGFKICADCASERGIQICNSCSASQATVHLTNIEDNIKKEYHLCETCAKHKGVTLQQSFAFPQIFSGLIKEDELGGGDEDEELLICEACGISWKDFRTGGRFGCANDYEVFRERLSHLIADIHARATSHKGKAPARLGAGRDKLRELLECQRLLEEAVEREEYEECAKLRDRLAELKDELQREKEKQ